MILHLDRQSIIKMHRTLVLFGIASLAICITLADSVEAQVGNARKLAPGVVKKIPIELNPRDTFTLPRALPGVDAEKYEPKSIPVEDTLWGQSHRVILYRDNVWEYEFSFLGLRQAQLRMPNEQGEIDNINVWYLVYRIRNTGASMSYEKKRANPDFPYLSYDLQLNESGESPREFRPRFILEGSIESNKQYQRVEYPDQISPILLEQIRRIEDPNQPLLDSLQMAKIDIPLAKTEADPGVWGVAIWKDVDPRIDYVSVLVRGLSNGFRLDSDPAKPPRLKTLQLNFWRPGDRIAERRDDVDYGIPLVEDPKEQVLICQRYQLPGPQLKGYQVNEMAKRNVLVVETDAQIDLEDFESKLTPVLDAGKLPASLIQSFADSGITIDQNAQVNSVIKGYKWTFSDGGEDYIIELEPEFWEPEFGKIRFIKSLDHLWIYR